MLAYAYRSNQKLVLLDKRAAVSKSWANFNY